MAEPVRPVAAVPAIPEEVTLHREDLAVPRFTPRELRTIKESFGRSFSEIMDDETSDEKFVALAWVKLRRLGYELEPGEMDDVLIEIRAREPTPPPDPTPAEPSTSSPPSAATGE